MLVGQPAGRSAWMGAQNVFHSLDLRQPSGNLFSVIRRAKHVHVGSGIDRIADRQAVLAPINDGLDHLQRWQAASTAGAAWRS